MVLNEGYVEILKHGPGLLKACHGLLRCMWRNVMLEVFAPTGIILTINGIEVQFIVHPPAGAVSLIAILKEITSLVFVRIKVFVISI